MAPNTSHCALVVLALTAASAAQATVPFDPFEHLEGYEECTVDEFADAYEVRTFQARRGEKVTPARLEELRVLWRAARERGVARKAKIAADVRQAALYRVERKLRKDPFFGRVDWIIDDTHLPYAFLLQQGGTEPALVRSQIQRFLPWFEAAESRIRNDVLVPAGANMVATSPCMTVLALASPGAYADFARVHRDAWGYYSGPIRWARAFDTIVVSTDAPADRDAARRVLEFAQGELAASLLHKCASGTLGLRPLWLVAGLSAHAGRAGAPSVGAPPLGPDAHVEQYVGMLLHPALGGHLGLFAEFARIDDRAFQALDNLSKQRGGGELRAGERAGMVFRAFQAQASLWSHYLLHHHRDAFLACVREALAGKDGPESLRAGFTPEAVAALEPAFAAWIRAEHLRLRPQVVLPDPLPVPRPALGASAGAPAAPVRPTPDTIAPAPGEPTVRPDHGALALTDAEWSIGHAAALAEACRGALSAAASRLQNVPPPSADAAGAARLQREAARVAAVLDLRRKLFETHVANKRILDIVFGSERVRGRVEAVADSTATLRIGRDARTFDLDVLDPAQLDLVLRRSNLLASKTWSSVFLQLLADKTPDKARGKLAAGDPDAAALAADLDGYAALFAQMTAARLLARVIDAGAQVATPAETLAELEELVRQHGALPFVASRRGALRSRAETLLEATFDPARAECLGVAGKLEFLGAGRVRLSYTGTEAGQIVDFVPLPDYLPELEYPHAAQTDLAPTITAARGAFELLGHGALRVPLAFQTPLKITCRSSGNERGIHGIAICDDRQGSCILVALDGSVMVVVPQQSSKTRRGSQDTVVDTSYVTGIEHDGTRVRTTVDGQESLVVTALGSRTKGGDVLVHLSARAACRLESLSIEGGLDEAQLPELRARFVARRVREIFGQ